ncbi:uncharacterized protein LOC119389684 [Rhipicephalus sanguineus]|uniref:MARVEL domain-containing protein n=1 Tax=Rhipicephalus sanguineus TaxID=34632 RepID=A0A9D4PXH6_RHISA|nr:uncharacterized protein LOC119389684 [Rhipicephalus sanguineus]KAH7956954.1 hypothetical protein HPB52_013919 [Rhipicephalus sanguineus]
MACYCEYVLTASGILKLFQMVVGAGIVFLLSEGRLDANCYLSMRLDALILFIASIVFFFNALLILVCVLVGALEIPGSTMYRMNYFMATFIHVPTSIAYLCIETRVGVYVQGSIAGALGILNSLMFLANAVMAYHPRVV